MENHHPSPGSEGLAAPKEKGELDGLFGWGHRSRWTGQCGPKDRVLFVECRERSQSG